MTQSCPLEVSALQLLVMLCEEDRHLLKELIEGRCPRVVKKLGRALGASLVWSESTAAGQVVPGSSDLLRLIEDGANS